MRRPAPRSWRAMRLLPGLILPAAALAAFPADAAASSATWAVAKGGTTLLELRADTVTHTVRQGETLSGIARDRLGSSARWSEILELNRDRVSRPELLLPGTVLRLPGSATAVAGEPDAGARLVEIEVTGGVVRAEAVEADAASARSQVPADYRERRQLLERRTFVPNEAPEPPEASRTIFYGTRTREVQQESYSEVVLTPMSELPVVQIGVARTAGWIVPDREPIGALGEITGFVDDRAVRLPESSVLEGQELRATLAPGSTVREGDRLTAARAPRRENGVGQILVPTGEVEVLSVEGDAAVLRLIRPYNRVQLGQLLVPVRELDIPVGVRPEPASRLLEARILAFEDRKDLYLSGDRLFVNVGARDGVSVGDEFTAWSGARAEGRDSGLEPSAEFQVIRVQENFATLRITRVREPRAVRVGAFLHLTASMP